MPFRIVRLGSERDPREGLRIGTVRRPPRGVRRQDFARRNYYDVWLPELAPSADLLSWVIAAEPSLRSWARFERRYRSEMGQSVPKHLLALLAALSRQTRFSVGCYCEDETRCHRSILRELLVENGALPA